MEVFLFFYLPVLILGSLLQRWPKALVGVAGIAGVTWLLINGWTVLDTAGCGNCRSGDMTGAGRVVLELIVTTMLLAGFLLALAIGAGVGWLVRRALR